MKKEKIIALIVQHPGFEEVSNSFDPRELKQLNMRQLLEVLMLLDNGIKGNGLFDSIKNVFKKAASKGNQLIHNIWRANNCQGRSRPLEEGELHFGCHNYTGPGTRIDLHPSTQPYNNIDACSRIHDLAYQTIGKQLKSGLISPEQAAAMVHKADMDALACYNKYPNEDGYKQATAGIGIKYIAEQALSRLRGKDSVIYS